MRNSADHAGSCTSVLVCLAARTVREHVVSLRHVRSCAFANVFLFGVNDSTSGVNFIWIVDFFCRKFAW